MIFAVRPRSPGHYFWSTSVSRLMPLLSILGQKSGIPPFHHADRIQRWALILAAYVYDLEFRKAEDHGNADMLSRFPLASRTDSAIGLTPTTLYHVDFVQATVMVADVLNGTEKYALLYQVKERLLNGWTTVERIEK